MLNTDRGLSDRASTRLHRAGCFTLEPGFGGGARRTVDYIKVCSPEPKELNEWAVANLGYGLRSLRCQHCDPSSIGLTDSPASTRPGITTAASRDRAGSAAT